MSSGRKTKTKRLRIARPAPPPSPPASLVGLLKSEPKVLKYFQSLQANLEADVKVWKDRCKAQKEECEQLKIELERLKSKSANHGSSPAASSPVKVTNKNKRFQRSTKSSSEIEDDSNGNEYPLETDLPPVVVGVPIDDSIFDDVEDSSEEDIAMDDATSADDWRNELDTHIHQDDPMGMEDAKEIFCFLKEAYCAFETLGIALVNVTFEDGEAETAAVEKVAVEDEGDGLFTFGKESDDENTHSTTPLAAPTMVKVIQRSDESIMTEIVTRIRNCTLVPKQANADEDFDLVSPTHLIPYCSPIVPTTTNISVMHPLLEGKRLLVRGLILIDTFCSPTLTQHEWDTYFHNYSSNSEDLKYMKLGLQGRKRLVDRLLLSLDEEISERWAVSDRSTRLSSPAVHFHADEAVHEASASMLLGDVTSRSKLGTLVERSVFSQLATTLHLLRDEVDHATRNVVNYLVSTAPSLSLEVYPKLPPVLSMVTLENLLSRPDTRVIQCDLQQAESEDETGSTSWFHRHCSSWSCRQEECLLVFKSLALAIQVSVSIWGSRLYSSDERIHDVACIELASYRRLLASDAPWLQAGDSVLYADDRLCQLHAEIDWLDKAQFLVNELLDGGRWQTLESDDKTSWNAALCIGLQIALIVRGEVNALDSVVREHERNFVDSSRTIEKRLNMCDFIMASSRLRRNVVLRQLDALHQNNGIPGNEVAVPILDSSGFHQLVVPFSQLLSTIDQLRLLFTAVECSIILSDGNSALRLMQRILQIDALENKRNLPDMLVKSFFDFLRKHVPVVRVINLERRKDRLKEFVFQAVREHLLVIKGVTSYKIDKRTEDPDLRVGDGFEFGLHAVDGQGRLADANEHLVKQVGHMDQLNKVVSIVWRPNDLKPFDLNAPDTESLVRMSPTERACALSHVASWKGVLRSLRIPLSITVKSKILRYPNHILRLFKISGFADGPALLSKNDHMPPAPVCVILEDDAILVDRFAMRLADLLKELPRDFHFCSLGYSRPKSAPIVPFSDKIGIPSMLWYLTGYCLSEVGATYLLDSLPVVGPVDSWIGLKMTNNWDNVFGMKLGVGVHASPNSELPAHKDLCRILQFRAFCALQPLCTQKVRVAVAAATAGTVVAASTGRNWRQRDTDIEYSGDMAKVGRALR